MTEKTKGTIFIITMFSLPFLFLLFILYCFYVEKTATRTKGCFYYYDECIKSHTETYRSFHGYRWYTTEEVVCDEYKTVKIPCDCVEYHWFWKN